MKRHIRTVIEFILIMAVLAGLAALIEWSDHTDAIDYVLERAEQE